MALDTSNWSVADWDNYLNQVSEEQNGTIAVRNAPADNSANAKIINKAFHKSNSVSSNKNTSSSQSRPGKKAKAKPKTPTVAGSSVPTKAIEKATGGKFQGLGKNVPVWQAKQILQEQGFTVKEKSNSLEASKPAPANSTVSQNTATTTATFSRKGIEKALGKKLPMLPKKIPEWEAIALLKAHGFTITQKGNEFTFSKKTETTTRKTIPGYEMKSSPLYSSPSEQSQKSNAFVSGAKTDFSQVLRFGMNTGDFLLADFKNTWSRKNLQTVRYLPGVAGVGAVASAGAGAIELAGSDILKMAGVGVASAIGLAAGKGVLEKKKAVKTGAVTQKRNSLISQSRSVNVSIQKKTSRVSMFGNEYLNINKKKNQYKKTNKYDFANKKKNQNRNRNKNDNGFDFFNPNQDDFLNRDILKDINTLKNKNKNVNENENEDINENREETRTETETKAQDININKFINENVNISKPKPKKKKIPLFIPFFMRKTTVKKIKKARKTRKELTVKEYIHPFGSFMGMRKAAAVKRNPKKSHKKGSKKPWWRKLV